MGSEVLGRQPVTVIEELDRQNDVIDEIYGYVHAVQRRLGVSDAPPTGKSPVDEPANLPERIRVLIQERTDRLADVCAELVRIQEVLAILDVE